MEDLKKIISVFIKKDIEDISNNTLINDSVIPGSVLIHRMYASLDKAGYKVAQYNKINTYGDLISILNGGGDTKASVYDEDLISGTNDSNHDSIIGVDIERVDNLPVTDDFREHEFYKNNFTDQEISYSLFKPNPYETLTGLFSAKEALCKVNNKLRTIPFNKIDIQHTPEGKPTFQHYSISISHCADYAVAVALTDNNHNNYILTNTEGVAPTIDLSESAILQSQVTTPPNKGKVNFSLIIAILSLLIALTALYLVATKA